MYCMLCNASSHTSHAEKAIGTAVNSVNYPAIALTNARSSSKIQKWRCSTGDVIAVRARGSWQDDDDTVDAERE